ncbi:hypothetical protein F4604DRAFT_1955921 [Suillus subluteus]|nr:hypothetical protein F4604DRAFT_1955921 [Suillus subluteus]
MTSVSNYPAWLSFISASNLLNYITVVSSAAVVYDWALTFGQEFELVWMHVWSFTTVLYICVRYIGILYSVIVIINYLPFSMTDVVGRIFYFIITWTPVVVNALLGVIIMIQIHVMYQRSKKMLVFLVVFLLASTIASSVITVMANIGVSVDEFVFLGYRMCVYTADTYHLDLGNESLIPTAIWEILAFVLAIWIVIKHFRELRQSSTGLTVRDYFMVLTKSHAFYFGAFAVVACFSLGSLSTDDLNSPSAESIFITAVLPIAQVLQMFVLGPRLILSIREYHAKLVARSDGGTDMTSIYLQAGGDMLAGGDV